MKVALVHDWLIDMGPEEKYLESLCALFPDAVLYTLFWRPDRISSVIARMDIRPTRLQNWPFIATRYPCYLPLFPAFIEYIDLRGYNLVISNSRYFAKGVLTQPETCHICILHPAVMTLWGYSTVNTDPHRRSFKYPGLGVYYRLWDIVASQRVDRFFAGSEPVALHIRKYYRREASGCLDTSADPALSGQNLLHRLLELTTDYQSGRSL